LRTSWASSAASGREIWKITIVKNQGTARYPAWSDEALQALVDAIATDVPKILRAPMNAKNEVPGPTMKAAASCQHRVKLSMLSLSRPAGGPYQPCRLCEAK
jgi:hypothetical protein